MKKVLSACSLALAVSSGAFAEAPVVTKSPAFSKGECSVAYLNAGEKASAFKVIKKDSLTKLNQKLPTGTAAEACSSELKAEFKITATAAQDCQVHCNPN